jgi:hypothetical protein
MATITETLKWLVTADSSSAIAGFEKAGSAADKELGKAESKLDKVGGNLAKTGAGAMAFAGIAGAALFKASGSFEDLAISSGKFSDTTGVSVQQASRWKEVTGDIGIGSDVLESSLNKMNKTLGATPEAFANAGVAIAKTKDGATDVNETFLNVVDRLNSIQDPAARAALATQLLGKGWTGMSELIAQGSDGLRKSLDAVSGAKTIDEKELAKAKEFRGALDNMHDSLEDIVLSIGQGAAPAIATLATNIGTAVGWVSKLDAVSGGAAGSVAATGVAILGTAGAVSFMSGKVIQLRDHLKDASAAVVGVGTVASLALFAMSQRASQAAKELAFMTAAAKDLSRATDEMAMKDVAKALAEGIQAGKSAADTYKLLAETNLEGTKRALELARAYGATKEQIDGLTKAIADEDAARQRSTKTTSDYADSADGASESIGKTTEQVKAEAEAEEGSGEGRRRRS